MDLFCVVRISFVIPLVITAETLKLELWTFGAECYSGPAQFVFDEPVLSCIRERTEDGKDGQHCFQLEVLLFFPFHLGT